MYIRRCLAGAALAAGLFAMTACGNLQAGTAVPAAQASTTSSSTSSSTTEPTQSPTSEEPPTSTADESTPDESTPDEPTNTGPIPPTTRTSASGADVDEVTEQWVTGMCTDMGSLLDTMSDVPKVTESSSVGEYRTAFVQYYVTVGKAGQNALDDANAGTPPNVSNGAEIHTAFVRYLTGLVDIASNGATLVEKETAAADISADLQQISKEIEDLSTDFDLGKLASPELAAAIQGTPACRELLAQG
jgi:hypothetical protein